MGRNTTHIYQFLFFIFVILGSIDQAHGQKVDKIQLANGDVITGEIKLLEYGKLTYKTDDAGTLSVKWDKVDFISSPHVFELMDKSGQTYYGSLAFGAEPGNVNVVVGPASTAISLLDIVSITPIKSRFFKRLSGSIQLGLGYTKENDLAQVNYNSNISYRYKKIYSDLTFNGQFTVQYDTSRTQRQDYNLNLGRNLKKRYFAGGIVGFEQNSALNLQLRSKLGIAFGRAFIKSNRNNFASYAAFQATKENYFHDASSTNNLEFVLRAEFRRFLYHTPKSEIYTDASIIPNLTTWGRIRAEINVNLKQEIIKDFTVNLNFYTSYDNKPPGESTANTDWGVNLTLGYSL